MSLGQWHALSGRDRRRLKREIAALAALRTSRLDRPTAAETFAPAGATPEEPIPAPTLPVLHEEGTGTIEAE